MVTNQSICLVQVRLYMANEQIITPEAIMHKKLITCRDEEKEK